MKKALKITGIIISVLILLAGSFLLFTALWVRRTWTKLSAGSIIFQLQNSLSGTGNGMVKTFVLSAAVPAVVVTVISLVIFFVLKRRKIIPVIYGIIGLGLSVLAVSLVWKRIGLGEYLKYRNKNSSFIENNYVSPEGVDIVFPEKKRNVIYIYLESMEISYSDRASGGMMEQNHIPNLTELSERSENFSGDSGSLNGAYSMYGTDWTMGAIFAESSGLPLIIPIHRNSMFTQSEFFPTVKTFGDVLADNGYKNVFLLGSDAEFGGRDIFFSSHGEYDIHDYKYARKSGMIPDDYMVFWGYEDEKLFKFAKEELKELSSSGEPFNLTMLTVDTHFEDGYSCRLCEDGFDDQYENVIACSDRQVARFVEWCMTQDFYKDTTIIISGDHPTMDRDFSRKLGDITGRRVYVSIINPAEGLTSPDHEREYTTFDLFPTSLAAMGVKIGGERLGLGTNLYSGMPTLLERYGMDEFNTQLMMKSDFMEKLADIDTERGNSFLEDVDESLKQLSADISLERLDEDGKYRISANILSDRPSCMNYIRRIYVTLDDGTYSYSSELEYNNEYSISEGKTCYETEVILPLTRDVYPEDLDNYLYGYNGNEFDEYDPFFTGDYEHERTGVWDGNVEITLTIDSYNDASFSKWRKSFNIYE